MTTKPKILISGALGYIGSVLTPYLFYHLKDEYDIVAVDNFYHGKSALPTILSLSQQQQQQQKKGLSFCRLDVYKQLPQWLELVEQSDIIIPLAALVGAPLCKLKPQLCYKVNEEVIKETVLAVVKSPLSSSGAKKRILFPNTNSGYGRTTSARAVDEDWPFFPISDYGRSKVNAETALLHMLPGQSVSFRLGTVFGVSPRMRMDLLVNDFVYSIALANSRRNATFGIYEPHFRRNCVHILDVVQAFLWAIQNPSLCGVYNLTLPEANLTKMELAKKVCEVMGVSSDILIEKKGKDNDQRDCMVSSKKVMDAGFVFQHSLEEGIRQVSEYVSYYTKEDLTTAAVRNDKVPVAAAASRHR